MKADVSMDMGDGDLAEGDACDGEGQRNRKRPRFGQISIVSSSGPYAFSYQSRENVDLSNSRSAPYAFNYRDTKKSPRVSDNASSTIQDLRSDNIGERSQGDPGRSKKDENIDNSHIIGGPLSRKRERSLITKAKNTNDNQSSSRHGVRIPAHRPSRSFELDTNQYIREHPNQQVQDGRVLIDIDALENELEAEIYEDKLSNPQPVMQEKGKVPVRNMPISLPWIKQDSIRCQHMTLKAGKTVELRPGSFLFIVDVIQNLQTDEVKLRGWELQRCSSLEGQLRRGLNELCFIYEVELDDPRSLEEQAMIETELQQVVKVRELIRTNYPFPYLRFSDPMIVSDDKSENQRFARDNDRLVARWKYITKYENRAERLRVLKYPLNIQGKRLEILKEEECTKGYHLDPLVSRFLWRGETILGGSCMRFLKQLYTYGDACKICISTLILCQELI